jgi:hypothetical protein
MIDFRKTSSLALASALVLGTSLFSIGAASARPMHVAAPQRAISAQESDGYVAQTAGREDVTPEQTGVDGEECYASRQQVYVAGEGLVWEPLKMCGDND